MILWRFHYNDLIPGGIYEALDRGRDEFSHPSFIMKSAFIRPLPLMAPFSRKHWRKRTFWQVLLINPVL